MSTDTTNDKRHRLGERALRGGADRAQGRCGRGAVVPGHPRHDQGVERLTAGCVAVIEHLAPRGSGSPLHVHHNEDEWFYITEGELTFWVGGQVVTAPAGSFVYGPRNIPHTFTVSSEQATVPAGGRASGLSTASSVRRATHLRNS